MSGTCFNTYTRRRHNGHHLKAFLEADSLGTSRILPLIYILKDTPMPHAEYLHFDPLSIRSVSCICIQWRNSRRWLMNMPEKCGSGNPGPGVNQPGSLNLGHIFFNTQHRNGTTPSLLFWEILSIPTGRPSYSPDAEAGTTTIWSPPEAEVPVREFN